VATEPEPIWMSGMLVPLKLTPEKITVMRFTQEGMPVKSTDVGPPDEGKGVVPPAFTVPDVITLDAIVVITAPEIAGLVNVLFVNVCVVFAPTNVVVASGNVSVRVLADDGASRRKTPAPLAFPDKASVVIFVPYSYKMLIEPASNVLVVATNERLVKVPAKVMLPTVVM